MAGEQRGVEKHQFIPEDYFREQAREALFPAGGPLELDVGCGEGGFLLEMAAQHPERQFLGLERLLGRVRKVCRRAERQQLTNVKVLRLESGYALEYVLPREAFDRIHLLFPDPWPKKRHHRRRLVQAETVPALARVLKPGGQLLFKSDHADYFDEAVEVICHRGQFTRLPWEEDAFFYPKTDFEQHWLGQGKSIHRALFQLSVRLNG